MLSNPHGERVSVIQGKVPVVLVAPHGHPNDDMNTGQLCEKMARSMNAHAVINWGWQRGDEVDIYKEVANCNSVPHCNQDVVKEEFLDPLMRFCRRSVRDKGRAFVVFLHGMSSLHRIVAGDPELDIVLGFGAGSPPSYSCEPWRKNTLAANLTDLGLTAYEGRAGGPMSGRARSNMNQLFRLWYNDPRVESVQMEIIFDLRLHVALDSTAEKICLALEDCVSRTQATTSISPKPY